MVSKFCEKCGTKREENSLFCIKCGCRFPDDSDIKEINSSDEHQVNVIATSDTIENAQEDPKNYGQVVLQDARDKKAKKVKKPSYKVEVLVLMLSVVCFIGSLGFFLVMKTTDFDSISFVRNLKYTDDVATDEGTEIPELTVEEAAKIINNSVWCFPYYHFEELNMLNKNDYIIHPMSLDMDYEIKCYTADGINTKEDLFNYFKQYVADDNLIREIFDQEHFFIEQNSKIYFSPNEWMGWYPYFSECMVLEKIDDETYLTYEGYDEPYIIKYVDGSFKLTSTTLEEATAPYIDKEATVLIPDISGLSLDEAETELIKAGLNLDRSNITYIAAGDFLDSYNVLRAKEYYKKVKSGASIGVYYVVEDPDFFKRGADNGEEIPELTKEMAAEIMTMAANWPIISFSDKGMIDRDNPISVSLFDGDVRNGYPIIGIETPEEYYAYFSEYATNAIFRKTVIFEYYVVENGKIYLYSVDSGDGGYGADWLIVEKIDEATYFVFDTYYSRESIIIYIDGKFKACAMSPDIVRDICSDEDATVKIPDLNGMSVDEAARELNKVGLYLDRSDMTSIKANGWDGYVLIAKNSCKKVKSGASVGVYLVNDNW